jgi:hypothetical protein
MSSVFERRPAYFGYGFLAHAFKGFCCRKLSLDYLFDCLRSRPASQKARMDINGAETLIKTRVNCVVQFAGACTAPNKHLVGF